MRWALLQAVVVFLIVASNIRWQWTPNGYLAALIGFGGAYLVTVSLNWLIALCARKHLRTE